MTPVPHVLEVLHVVVGPTEHGVVRHGLLVANACGDPVLRLDRPRALHPDELGAATVVHVPFTDRLFAPRCEDAATAFEAMVAAVLADDRGLSVTLHDLPASDDALDRRRAAAYTRVVARARGVVVNSDLELHRLNRLAPAARSVRRIPLPLEPPAGDPGPAPWRRTGRDVVVLGFVFPDRGYEHTIDELPAGVDALALGRPSDGHDDLVATLTARASVAGHGFATTGFVPDAELSARLWSAGVPVAPNRRVAASGSIATWVAHGRRPLVPDGPYARELAERWPGAIATYDADRPGALRSAVAAALADPAATWCDPAGLAPSAADVAVAYARHFDGCRPDAPVPVGVGRWTVPGNRWDLLPPPPAAASVTVVVPHFDDQARLDLVLAGLAAQDHAATRLQVVVADDGSPHRPDLSAAGGLTATLVRQERAGFRAAAARNLGVAAADGDVLLFLDGDTVPEPAYVRTLSALPAVSPDALVVGRRRHADLTGWTPDRLRAWFAGGPGPEELPEPAWLSDAYAASRDLLDADARSYRFVISAVLGLPATLFAELGGFDPGFDAYGGEDWELAHRAWCGGAVFAHVRDAVAWHDGPDWAGRADRGPGDQNAETLRLTHLLPDPVARGGGQWIGHPAIVVELAYADPATVLVSARAAFADDTDAGVWVDAPGAADTVLRLRDPRIHAGRVPDAVAARAATRVRVDRPVRLGGLTAWAEAAARHGPLRAPGLTVTPTRVLGRATRWGTELESRLFGGRDVPGPDLLGAVDVAHELKRLAQARERSVRRS